MGIDLDKNNVTLSLNLSEQLSILQAQNHTLINTVTVSSKGCGQAVEQV